MRDISYALICPPYAAAYHIGSEASADAVQRGLAITTLGRSADGSDLLEIRGERASARFWAYNHGAEILSIAAIRQMRGQS